MFSVSRELIRPRFFGPLALLATFLTHSWFGPDVFYHLAWGRDVVTRARLVPVHRPLLAQPIAANVYWLFQGALYLVHQLGGPWLGSLVFALLWFAIFVSWARVATLARWTLLGPWLALLMILAAQSRFEQRPEVVSYLFLALLVSAIAPLDLRERVPRRTFVTIALLHAAWCNVHGFFALGPLILGAKLATTALGTRDRRALGRGLGLVASAAAACVISPFGWHTWETVAAYADLGPRVKDLIQELAPPPFAFSSPTLVAFWISVALTLARLVTGVRRRAWFAVILGGAGLVLAAHAVRNLPLLFVLGAPLWTTGDAAAPPRAGLARLNAALVFLVAAVFGAAFVSGAYGNAIGYLGSFGVHLEPASYPVAAAEYLRTTKFAGRLFNDSYDGGYLEFTVPAATVAGDSYFSDPGITREYLDAIRRPADLSELDRRFAFDVFLINVENGDIIDQLLDAPGVRLAHVSPHRALFVRDGSAAGPPAGAYYAGDDLHHWANAFGPARWIAIARRHRDLPRLRAIVADLVRAPAIPAALLGAAVTAPPPAERCEFARAARAVRDRVFADDALDPARLDLLLAAVGPCAE